MTATQQDLISALRNFDGGFDSFMTPEEIQDFEKRRQNQPENSSPIDTDEFLRAAEESFSAMPISVLESIIEQR
ncbi:MAG: hypothetical protein IKO41_20720 [Lachnospiraceae bacterium]|nr:hypothetical protein [Desulfovibrio sp.]MBR4608615.1 hypothetical protein [Lachnospiraceae bacterium]